MSETSPAPRRGNPPNREKLAELLGERLELWNEVRETVLEIGATWKWAYSEATESWSYRSYQEGDRFFVAMTPTAEGFEVSLNLKPDEMDTLIAETPDERATLERLRSAVQGPEPAWIHLPVTEASVLPFLAKVLVVRARRPQKPRLKGGRKQSP